MRSFPQLTRGTLWGEFVWVGAIIYGGKLIWRGNCPGAIFLGGYCPGGNYPGYNHPGVNYPGGNFPRGQLS